MPFSIIHPGPGNGNGSFPISQANDQQLMRKSTFVTIHDQPDLLKMTGLTIQPAASNGLIPDTYIDRRVGQQAAQALYETEQLSFSWEFSCNPAQINRTTLLNSSLQPNPSRPSTIRWCLRL